MKTPSQQQIVLHFQEQIVDPNLELFPPGASTFTRFSSLPVELRRKIWRYTVRGRDLTLYIHDDGPAFSPCNPPVALHVNYESRSVILPYYLPCKFIPYKAEQSASRYLKPSVFLINPTLDKLEICRILIDHINHWDCPFDPGFWKTITAQGAQENLEVLDRLKSLKFSILYDGHYDHEDLENYLQSDFPKFQRKLDQWLKKHKRPSERHQAVKKMLKAPISEELWGDLGDVKVAAFWKVFRSLEEIRIDLLEVYPRDLPLSAEEEKSKTAFAEGLKRIYGPPPSMLQNTQQKVPEFILEFSPRSISEKVRRFDIDY